MDQIALPYRVALVALLAAAALWFTVLRPKGDSPSTAPSPQAPGVAGLNRAIDKAKGASGASDAANAAAGAENITAPGAAGTHAGTQAAPGATAPAAAQKPADDGVAAGDPSAPLVRALGEGKVVVMLFWNRSGADDRAARAAIAGVGRHHGAVVVKTAPVKSVGRYEAITRGAKVTESPTILVIDALKIAVPIVGYTTAGEVNQTVADALDATAVLRRSTNLQADAGRRAKALCGAGADAGACRDYLARANAICTDMNEKAAQAGVQAGATGDLSAALGGLTSGFAAGVGQLTALKPPASRAPAHTRATAILRAQSKSFDRAIGQVRGAVDQQSAFAQVTRRLERSKAIRSQNRELERLGYAACAA